MLNNLVQSRCELRKDGKYVYYFLPNTRLHTLIGTIKKKNDSRFEWTQHSPGFAPKGWVPTTPNQGVCDTYQAAVEMLYKGWDVIRD